VTACSCVGCGDGMTVETPSVPPPLPPGVAKPAVTVIEVADEDEGRMGPGDPTPTVVAGDEWITPAITPCWSKDD